jgi:hypothetical protein
MDGGQPEVDARVETITTLQSLARRRFGKISEQRLAEHLVRQMGDADWPVLKAALDALARRYGFAQRDGLKLVGRVPLRNPLRVYQTRAAVGGRRSARPYRTAVLSLAPLRLSCSCADFVRSSLGLCKHGLVILEALEAQRVFAGRHGATSSAPPAGVLGWADYQSPLGSTDRLERLRFTPGARLPRIAGWKAGGPAVRLAQIAKLQELVAHGRLELEPAVETLLEEERVRAQRAHDSAAGVANAVRALRTLKRKLYPYQREGVKRFFEAGRLLLADDMGLGKTTQAIAGCHGLYESQQLRRGLLIVPAALKGQWLREWQTTTHVPIEVVNGAQPERARVYARVKQGFLVIGYEQLLRDFEAVAKFAPDIVVLDEAQRIKNWATKSAAYVKALSPKYRLVLTGTPMENRFDELASVMDFVDDLALEPKWRLTPFHAQVQGDAGSGRAGARHLASLRSRLQATMVRRVRQEVLSQLPARADTRVPVELTAVQRDEHEDLRRPIAALLQQAATRPLRQAQFLQLMSLLTRQRMICNGMAQVRFAEDWPRCQAELPTPHVLESLFAPKLSALRGLVEQVVVGQRRKAVVFSQWRNMVRLGEWAVRDLLTAAGLRAVFFTGAESAKLRERAIIELHDDPAAAVMFLTDAGGVGLNLQRAASCCVNLELPWNPAVLEQRIGRIYRLGQTLPIDVYNLVSEDCIESRIATLVERKRAVFSGLFDGVSDEVVFAGQSSFLDGIKHLVEPVAAPLPASEDAEALEMPPAVDEPMPAASSEPRGLIVEKQADGSLRIAAPPQLAEPLAALLEQLARGLRA